MRKLRPHHLILGFWLVLAGAFGLSGVVSTITQQHDDSTVSREVFGNIPLYTRCRERDDPFTQSEKNFVAMHTR